MWSVCECVHEAPQGHPPDRSLHSQWPGPRTPTMGKGLEGQDWEGPLSAAPPSQAVDT